MDIDLSTILSPILQAAGLAVAGLIGVYVPKVVGLLETKLHIQLTQQQVYALSHQVQIAAGAIETRLDQGALKLAHVEVNNPEIATEAQAAIAAIPVVASSLGLTQQGVARMIVSAVDTSAHPGPAPANAEASVSVTLPAAA